MKKVKLLLILLIIGIIQSCSSVQKIYFYDQGDIDGGEIWDSDLEYFFMRKERLSQVKGKSSNLSGELNKILSLIKDKNHSEVDDGDFYEYAFVFKNQDTLYTNSGFEIWRYKNVKAKVSNNVKEYIKAAH